MGDMAGKYITGDMASTTFTGISVMAYASVCPTGQVKTNHWKMMMMMMALTGIYRNNGNIW